MQNRKGFTIIELIVVIAIIAILAAVVMVNVTQYINKSKDASTKVTMNEYIKKVIITIADTGEAPDIDYSDPIIASLGYPSGSSGPHIGKNGNSVCLDNSIYEKKDSLYIQWCVDTTGFNGAGSCGDGSTGLCQVI